VVFPRNTPCIYGEFGAFANPLSLSTLKSKSLGQWYLKPGVEVMSLAADFQQQLLKFYKMT
jgi:hypothetical protein